MTIDKESNTVHVRLVHSAEDFLMQARDEMRERASSRDTEGGERSMGRCITAFNALYGGAIAERVAAGEPPLSETMGWQLMSILKKARGATGAYRADDYTDDVAYAALAAECASHGHQLDQVTQALKTPGVAEPPPPADTDDR